jgi:hypothetical protein
VVQEAQRVAAAFALGTPHRPAPARLRKRTFRAAGVARPSPLEQVLKFGKAVAGVAAVLVAAGAFTGMVLVRDQVDDLRSQNGDLQTQIDSVQQQKVEIAALTVRLNEEERTSSELRGAAKGDRDLLLALLSTESDIADVVSVDEDAQAIGRLVWDEAQKRVWFVATHLPERPTGQTYQIWVNSSGRWVSLGTFNSDSTGYARYETLVPEGLKSYDSAVVTIERAGGSPERSGDSVFVADLSGLR